MEKLPKVRGQEDKSKIGNVFKSMSLYFIEFASEKQQYEDKITELLKEIVRLRKLLSNEGQRTAESRIERML